jgi:adenylate cyclase
VTDGGKFLRDAVLALGIPEEEVARAEADGTLELVAMEHMVSEGSPELDLQQVAARSGLTPELIRAFWRALGFPDPRPDELVFTETDIELLSDVVRFIDDGSLDEGLALQMARVIGSALNRVAVAEVDAVEGQMAADRAGGASDLSVTEAALRAGEILPIMPRVLEQVWRRHLSAATRRRIVRASTDEGKTVCVGFADLVGFTATTQELPEQQLAEVVGNFETIAFDLVSSHGGRVVKMIGDEVMFMTDGVISGAKLALDMAATYREAEHLSDVRVGLASGRVLERDGDIFGPVVNLASRIVNVAFPGAVVVSPDIRDVLQGTPGFVFRSLRSHYLKDIGRVPLWVMRAADDDSEAPFSHERHRRSARSTFTLGMTARPMFEQLGEALAPVVPAKLRRADPDSGEPGAFDDEATTGQLAAISEAVLDADIDEELQLELLADIEASRRLHHLEQDTQRRSELVDLEFDRRVAAAEHEARRKVEAVEAEARRQIEEALEEAEEKARKANTDANRKVAQVEEAAERKAAATKRDARRKAKRKTERKKRKDRDERESD